MIIPPYLKKGDTVAIICTARKFFPEDAQPAIELLESWGLKVKLGTTIGLDNFQLGGTDDERAADLQAQLDDAEVKAIWCARGGYGTVRIIDKVDFSNFKENPKWLMGFSDVTVLHSHLNTLGVATLHSIMPFTVPKAPEDVKETLRKALFGESLAYVIPSKEIDRKGDTSASSTQVKGELVGGNISILYSLLGSKSAIVTEDKILFIEDLDEYLYHLDRMMYNIKRNGYFDKVKGIIVGSLTDMHDNEIPFGQNAVEIITEITAAYNIPIAFDFPAGHQADNRTLILGSQVEFEIDSKKISLKFL